MTEKKKFKGIFLGLKGNILRYTVNKVLLHQKTSSTTTAIETFARVHKIPQLII